MQALDRISGSRLVSKLVIAGLLLATLLIGIWLVPFPGLQYDEALFVNAATGGGIGSDSTSFVTRRVFGVPVLLMDYIGALKAWLYTPIFALFGVSIPSIRIPMVLVFVGSVAIAVLVVWRYSRPWVAVVTTLLLTTDPVFALMSRADWGPVAIAGFLRVGAIYALLRLVESRQRRWFALASLALGIGVFNKLDYALFAASLLVSAAWVFWQDWRDIWRHQRKCLAASLSFLFVVYGLAYYFMYRPAQYVGADDVGSLVDRVSVRTRLVADSFDGGPLTQYMTGTSISSGSRVLLAALVSLAAAAAIFVGRRAGRRREAAASAGGRISVGRVLALMVSTAAFLLIAIVVSRGISGPHHGIMFWPLPALVIGLSLGLAAESGRYSRRLAWPTLTIVVLAAAGGIATQIATYRDMAAALVDPEARTVIWTDESEQTAAAVSRAAAGEHPPRVVVVTDWGIGNQLRALIDPMEAVDVIDGWPTFANAPANDASTMADAMGIVPGDHFLVAGHTEAGQIFAGTVAAQVALVDYCRARGGDAQTLQAGRDIILLDVTC